MKNLILLFILILLFQQSCTKDHSETTQNQKLEPSTFKICDSVIRVYNSMTGGIITENHNIVDRDIIIYKNVSSGELVYNSDTFIIYNNAPLTYSNKHSSFPLLEFNNDSLSINRHIGGVGYQTWELLKCIKR